jgi:peptidoglycan/LPS O-acetylase OafA/YrhL
MFQDKINRNGNIEILRFLFAISVVIYHLFDRFNILNMHYTYNIAVPGFMIITGFFCFTSNSSNAKRFTKNLCLLFIVLFSGVIVQLCTMH